ncbi:MAG: hypothetical protein ACRECJ_10415, partial [Limisphaerales bacterium]
MKKLVLLMGDKTKLGLSVLTTASFLGIIGDLLLRASPWGLNFLLWIFALFGVLVLLARRWNTDLAKDAHWISLTVLPFAVGFVWRDSGTLKFLNAVAVFTTLSFLTMRAQAIQLQLAGLLKYI